jgi:hypothetical protein
MQNVWTVQRSRAEKSDHDFTLAPQIAIQYPKQNHHAQARLFDATDCGNRFRSTARYPAASERAGCIDREGVAAG